MNEEGGAWLVWKFGGTSVANASRLINVANLISTQCDVETPKKNLLTIANLFDVKVEEDGVFQGALSRLPTLGQYRLAVVVSAMGGVTDSLQAICDEAAMDFHRKRKQVRKASRASPGTYRHLESPKSNISTPQFVKSLEEIKKRHLQTVDELIEKNELHPSDAEAFHDTLISDLVKINDVLRAFSISGSCPPSLKELIMGHGELWSSRLLYGILRMRHSRNTEPVKGGETIFTSDDIENEDVMAKGLKDHTTDEVPVHCEFCSSYSYHVPSSLGCRSNFVRWIDARQILTIKDACSTGVHEKVLLNYLHSKENMEKWLTLHPMCRVAIITGYICSTGTGIPTTLKRNGSDYSGSLFANLLKAKVYTVWTDVDGVYTADPRKVPSAFRLPFLSYIEAIELAYFGAKVLHPFTMEPCISESIPIVLRSSLKPQSPGTLIGVALPESPIPTPGRAQASTEVAMSKGMKALKLSPSAAALTKLEPEEKKKALTGFCRAFTLIDSISLVNVAGTSMIGVPGIASRLFSAVHESACSVVMISQASSEHSICFAVLTSQTDRAKGAVEHAFYKEIRHDLSMKVSVTNQCTIICAVGERMCGAEGVLGRLSVALANAKVNIKAIAQGASETNITFVVDTCQANQAIQSMHDAIYVEEIRHTLPKKSLIGGLHEESQSLLEFKDDKLFRSTMFPKAKEVCIRIVFLVPVIPLHPSMQSGLLQMVSDMTLREKNPTPLERQSLPLRFVGYTDGLIVVLRSQMDGQPDASTFPHPAANDLLFDSDGLRPLVLIDLRKWLCKVFSGISPTTFLKAQSHAATRCYASKCSFITPNELNVVQDRFLLSWRDSGRMVINSKGVMLSYSLESVSRIVFRSDSETSQAESSEPASSHCNSEFESLSDFPRQSKEILDVQGRSSSVTNSDLAATQGFRRRRSFTTEDLVSF